MDFLNRVVQRQEARLIFASLPTEEMSCAEISGHYWVKHFKWRNSEEFHYPDHDITQDVFRDATGKPRTFDMIVADQVWEHLERPYAATRNVLRMLAPGGYFYIAVPFFARNHDFPVDCSRWNAQGLKNLLIEAGFDGALIEANQWGNFAAAAKDSGKKWAKYVEGDDLTNDPKCPIMAWALARKSPEAAVAATVAKPVPAGKTSSKSPSSKSTEAKPKTAKAEKSTAKAPSSSKGAAWEG